MNTTQTFATASSSPLFSACCAVMLLVGCGGGGGDAAAPAGTATDFSGNWTGTLSDSLTSAGTLTFTLTQSGTTVSGSSVALSANGTANATVSGSVSGNTLMFTLTQTNATCPGTFNGTATASGSTLSLTYTGSDCLGSHANGRASTTRQSTSCAVANPGAIAGQLQLGASAYARECQGTASPTALDVTTFTVEAWIFPTARGSLNIVSDGAYLLRTTAVSSPQVGYGLEFKLFTGSSTHSVTFTDFTGTRIPLNQWTHVAASYDRATDTCQIHVGGVRQVNTPTCTNGDALSTGLDEVFAVGTADGGTAAGTGGASSGFFQGRIDEVRVSNVARYAADFTPAATFSTDASTLGLWHFNEAAGATTFADSSGNGRTLSGASGAATVAGARP